MKSIQIGQFDGYNGRPRKIRQIVGPVNAVASHSCLLPRFSITFRVGELRKLVEHLDDVNVLTVTVSEHEAAQFTFVK